MPEQDLSMSNNFRASADSAVRTRTWCPEGIAFTATLRQGPRVPGCVLGAGAVLCLKQHHLFTLSAEEALAEETEFRKIMKGPVWNCVARTMELWALSWAPTPPPTPSPSGTLRKGKDFPSS